MTRGGWIHTGRRLTEVGQVLMALVVVISGAVLAGAVVVQLVDFAVSTVLVSASAATDVATAEATFSFAWILGAVLVLALAEIWAAGVRMRDDLAGVV